MEREATESAQKSHTSAGRCRQLQAAAAAASTHPSSAPSLALTSKGLLSAQAL